MKTDNSDITWEEIEKYLGKDSYQKFFKHISLSVFEMAGDKQNKSKVLKIVLKVLKERDPKNASEEYAQKMVNNMQKAAKKILEERAKK